MLLELFKRYLRVSPSISDRTVVHYITGLKTINSLLSKYKFVIADIFQSNSVDDLNAVTGFLRSNDEFQTKDSAGHNMYSAALNHFYRFVCEDPLFFAEDIVKMDIPVPKPMLVTLMTSTWRRNQIIINQAIEGAHYRCENNSQHTTFTSGLTGHPYMEGHHLIPIEYQAEFQTGIDVYSNVICLCPTCHRLLHFGVSREKSFVAERLYVERYGRLVNCGIDISKSDFLKMII